MGMFDIIGNTLGNVLDIVPNVIGGLSGNSAEEANKRTQESANNAFAMSQGSAERQMQFQYEMSNTAYQRAMADMKKAGLNPMLAFSQGGASVPGGASASAQGIQVQDKGTAAIGNIGKLAGASKDASQLGPAIESMKAQTRSQNASAAQAEQLTPATVGKIKAETNLTNATADKISVETQNAQFNNKKIAQEIKNLEKSGKIMDLDAEDRARIQKWKREHPHLFDFKQRMDHITPGVKAGQAAATTVLKSIP